MLQRTTELKWFQTLFPRPIQHFHPHQRFPFSLSHPPSSSFPTLFVSRPTLRRSSSNASSADISKARSVVPFPPRHRPPPPAPGFPPHRRVAPLWHGQAAVPETPTAPGGRGVGRRCSPEPGTRRWTSLYRSLFSSFFAESTTVPRFDPRPCGKRGHLMYFVVANKWTTHTGKGAKSGNSTASWRKTYALETCEDRGASNPR